MTTRRTDGVGPETVGGCTLETYAAISRALVRVPRGTEAALETVLAGHGLTDEAWARIRSGWAERIAADPAVRDAFRRAYVGE